MKRRLFGLVFKRGCVVRWASVATTPAAKTKNVVPVFKSSLKHKFKVCLRDCDSEYHYFGVARSGRLLSEVISGLLGGRKQERVAVVVPNNGYVLLAYWAVWMSGQIAVPLDPCCPKELLTRIIKDSGASLILTTRRFEEDLKAIDKNLQVHVIDVEYLDKARHVSGLAIPQEDPAEIPPSELLEENYGQPTEFYTDKDALLVYTAGTTGQPKGVLLSFSNLETQMKSVIEPWRLIPTDCVLNLRPTTSTDGISCGLLAPLSLGAGVVLKEKFSVEEVWGEILQVPTAATKRVNVMYGEARMYRSLVEEFERVKKKRQWNDKMLEYAKGICIQKMRLMLSTGSPLPRSVLEKWETYMGHEILEVYSLTEGGVVTTPRPSTVKHTSTVGIPVPGVQMKIISDEGDVIAEGDSSGTKVLSIWEDRSVGGALWIKGDGIARKYSDHKKEKLSWTLEGWFKTGDVVSYSKGQYNVLGRQESDIVKARAYKISLVQVEAAILDIPEVEDVAAFSFTENGTSKIAAAISRKKEKIVNFEMVKKFLQDRLPDYAIPSIIIDVTTIPRNHRGLIVRSEIQSYLMEEFKKISSSSINQKNDKKIQ